MIHYDDYALQLIESEIINMYSTDVSDYTQCECLLDIRRRLLNDQALTRKNQEELLPHIIAFNDALRDALELVYNQAHEFYDKPDFEVEGKCFLSSYYPSTHPFQQEKRQDLWNALLDPGWNPLYHSGVTHSIVLPRDLDISFNSFIGMDCPPPNWNEGLDPELTKDLHLINAFHNLFDHTKFALTDFIFVRDFERDFTMSLVKK